MLLSLAAALQIEGVSGKLQHGPWPVYMNSRVNIAQMSVEALLEASRPRRAPSLLLPMMVGAVVIAAVISLPSGSGWLQPLVPFAFGAMIALSIWNATRVARRQRNEQELLRRADEGLRLGRWDDATAAMTEVLNTPSPRPHVKIQALIYVTAAWARVGKFGDVIKLCDYLLDQAIFPPGMANSLKCMRAYAMLRDERLSDSYQAISMLRREFPGGSAMMSVLELYRLVKTGHHEDAVQFFDARKRQLAEQLGHRSSDGWALAASSLLLLGRREESMIYARRACTLGEPSEIIRRFPECCKVMGQAMNGGTDAR